MYKKISGGGKVFDLRGFVCRWPPKLNNDMEFLLKAIIGGLVIAGVVTMAERGNPTVGALILGIPLASIVSLIFMHYSGVSPDVFSQLARETVYFVFVSLVFFPIFAYMVLHYGFWLSLSVALTVTFIALYSLLKAL